MAEAQTLSPAIPAEIEAAAERLTRKAHERDLSLATAESCTGGLIASLLTDMEGRSHVFERGFVVYSEDAKCDLLHVAREKVDACGAVSREVALAMADGALAASNADVALAVTGFAGPGGPDDEPGLVHFACARANAGTAHRVEHFGDVGRGAVRLACLKVALEMMEDAVDA